MRLSASSTRFDSPDGGGFWLPANTSAQTNTISLAPDGKPLKFGAYVYPWDVVASGFLGQSDNVVFRLEAYAALAPLPGSVANSYRSTYVATQSYPFRVSGSQVQVLDEKGNPVQGALVYRLPRGKTSGAVPLGAENGGSAFKTDAKGLLQGQGQILTGDRLVALQPAEPLIASQGYTYTLYHTSAAPSPGGLDAYTITNSGLQTLTTSSKHPLALFDLDVSLECGRAE